MVWVALGGALGAVGRALIAMWAAKCWGTSFPYGTLIVNATGSFLIGFLLTLSTERFSMPVTVRNFLVPGFLGGYTTFPAYSFDTVNLAVRQGLMVTALINVVLNNGLALLAAILGVILVQLWP
jgi:CrcB protein